MDCIFHIDVQELGYGNTCVLVDAFGRLADPQAAHFLDDDQFGSGFDDLV